MACCKNKGECRQNNEPMISYEGTPEAMSVVGVEFLTQLIEVAKGGLCDQLTQLLGNAVFKNAQLKSLADTVVALVAENEYLKKIANVFPQPEVKATPTAFELAFGPQNAYRLSVALDTPDARRNFAAQLRAAADSLDSKQSADLLAEQMTFLF